MITRLVSARGSLPALTLLAAALLMLLAGCGTAAPVTPQPTAIPTELPAALPTAAPTEAPTVQPTESTAVQPTEPPTAPATEVPPTEQPTVAPTAPALEAPTAAPTEAQPAGISYAVDVQPILEQRCLKCHGGSDGTKGAFSLKDYAALMKGGESGAVVAPGDPANSLMVQLIVDGEMPNRAPRLPQAEIDIISAWVAAGAQEN